MTFMAKCTEKGCSGIRKRNTRPDGLGRIIETCSLCAFRQVISGDENVVVPLSGSFVAARKAPRPAPSAAAPPAREVVHTVAGRALAPPVVGQPCQHCGQKVKKAKTCTQCLERPRLPGRRKCSECWTDPLAPRPRFCVDCGTRYTPKKGEGPAAAIRCPLHRKKKP